jgi:hypothetical protein
VPPLAPSGARAKKAFTCPLIAQPKEAKLFKILGQRPTRFKGARYAHLFIFAQ